MAEECLNVASHWVTSVPQRINPCIAKCPFVLDVKNPSQTDSNLCLHRRLKLPWYGVRISRRGYDLGNVSRRSFTTTAPTLLFGTLRGASLFLSGALRGASGPESHLRPRLVHPAPLPARGERTRFRIGEGGKHLELGNPSPGSPRAIAAAGGREGLACQRPVGHRMQALPVRKIPSVDGKPRVEGRFAQP